MKRAYNGGSIMRLTFTGRCGRIEFLMQVLFNALAMSFLGVAALVFPPVFFAAPLVIALFFSVTVRRLHDIGHSGFWCLLWFVPLLHLFLLLYLLLRKGDSEKNSFGSPIAAETSRESSLELKQTFAQMDAQIERQEHDECLWHIVETMAADKVPEAYFVSEFHRRYALLNCRIGTLFLSRQGAYWRVEVTSEEHPHIETDYEFYYE